MNFIIRKAEIKDARGIAKVHTETWQTHYRGQIPDEFLEGLSVEKRAEGWEKNLSDPKTKTAVFVAESGTEIVGFCCVGPSRGDEVADPSVGELYAIYVDSSKHGQGIGSALVQAGLDYLKNEGFKKATLWVLKTNISSIRFYESKGWKTDGKEKREEKDGFVFEEIQYVVDL
jgi:ribosomal protein S18 acetylase RimI-like enzyme